MASNAKHKSFMASNMLNEVLSEHFPLRRSNKFREERGARKVEMQLEERGKGVRSCRSERGKQALRE